MIAMMTMAVVRKEEVRKMWKAERNWDTHSFIVMNKRSCLFKHPTTATLHSTVCTNIHPGTLEYHAWDEVKVWSLKGPFIYHVIQFHQWNIESQSFSHLLLWFQTVQGFSPPKTDPRRSCNDRVCNAGIKFGCSSQRQISINREDLLPLTSSKQNMKGLKSTYALLWLVLYFIELRPPA